MTEQDPIDAVETLLRALSQTEPHDPELLLLYESLVAANRDEQLRDEIGASLAELRDRLCDWFAERGIASPRAVAVTLTAAIDGYLLQRSMDPALEPDSLIEGLVGMMRRQAQ
nr:TetR family transcriptional regulator C-terminal domain-containing protein [Microbacterium sp. MAH-37]